MLLGVVLFGERCEVFRLGAWHAGLHLSGASETVQRRPRGDWLDLLIHLGMMGFDWLGEDLGEVQE